MKKLFTAMSAALAFSFVAGAALPVAAMPFTPRAVVTSDAVEVQYQSRRDNRREMRRDMRRDRFERRGNRSYYNGHRGYRERRSGYRQYNGLWFPPAAFALGAIIGGSVNRPANVGNAHVRWCQNRWRSYRAYDNSYQPNNGPRQRCVSPYS